MCDHPAAMRRLVRIAGLSMLLAAAPAQACLSDGLPEAVLFDGPPARPPSGYRVIRVVATEEARDSDLLRVNFVDGPELRQFGPTGWLVPKRPSSCTGWGRLRARAFVTARAVGRLQGRVLLEATIYRRSWWDRFWSFFGITQYSAGEEVRREWPLGR